MKQKAKAYIKNIKWLYLFTKKLQRLKKKYKKPINGKNNVIINNGLFLNVKLDIVGDNNLIEIMPGSILSDMMIYMLGNNHHLKIGENVNFKGGNVWFEDHHCLIEIGRGTSIESAHLAVTEPHKKISIGEDCMISYGIELRTGDSHSILDNETRERINFGQNIEVGDHVWIGANTTVLKGVNIGHNSIIGTRSLVSKSIPSHSIAAGIPAAVVRNGVDWVRERIFP